MAQKIIKEVIEIKGARLHNLKNINLTLRKNKLIVVSGVSGSGKSSLAFHTLFAEGQRRYIESLSSYARQFLGKLKKPEVDSIIGICPAIAIEQKTTIKNPRSNLATATEVYDYLKLLYSKIGKTFSPISGREVKCHKIIDIHEFIQNHTDDEMILILAKKPEEVEVKFYLSNLVQQGFTRVLVNKKIKKIQDILSNNESEIIHDDIKVIIDRIILNNSEDNEGRIKESLENALYEGKGECYVFIKNEEYRFSNRFELDNILFQEPTINLFSFNNPYGACKNCEGFGSVLGVDENKVIKNENLSLKEEVVSCWSGKKLSRWKDKFIENSKDYNFPCDKAYKDLSKEEKGLLWNGKGKCKGIIQFFDRLEKDKYKIQNRVLISRYRGKTNCNECNGSGLRKDASYVKINGKSIQEILKMSVENALKFFTDIKLEQDEKSISDRIIKEIINRLTSLNRIGLGYLTLDRKSASLSGGESQRMNLATSLNSSLVGAMYILDEPSIGLHPQDTNSLIKILKNLKEIGNTVIVIEHDEEMLKEADEIIDLGPYAGENGGEIVYQGSIEKIKESKNSLTAKYLLGQCEIKTPAKRRMSSKYITISEASQYNIRKESVSFPLHCLTVVSGMSGSGKSTLIKDILLPAILNKLGIERKRIQNIKAISLTDKNLKRIEFVDQNPIGKSSRSNPATYIKVYDDIRNLFSKQSLSKQRKYSAGFFSFNVEGGRCSECSGDGRTVIEMQFMADLYLECESCKGTRFKEEVLEVKYEGKNISDILSFSVNEAIDFFNKYEQYSIVKKLQSFKDVGLGYVKLGQASNSLSGGEAQRIKLASFLSKGGSIEKTLFIFDEPTTGLHFDDINKLLNTFYALLNHGHSIICIEHNLDVIKCADWVIDLGPKGGVKGGKIIFQGTPEDLINCNQSITAKHLKKKLLV